MFGMFTRSRREVEADRLVKAIKSGKGLFVLATTDDDFEAAAELGLSLENIGMLKRYYGFERH